MRDSAHWADSAITSSLDWARPLNKPTACAWFGSFTDSPEFPSATQEFRTIVDHRGEVPASPLYPLAHLGLARAAVAGGNASQAREAYDAFFALWKDADSNLPALREARVEYERLR